MRHPPLIFTQVTWRSAAGTSNWMPFGLAKPGRRQRRTPPQMVVLLSKMRERFFASHQARTTV
jgi:hypothetical protein